MRKITAILLALVMLFGGFFGGFLIGESKQESYKSYEKIYEDVYSGFKNLNTDAKIEYYREILKSETSPTQVKFILNMLLKENLDNDVKNNMIALYLNHIQYYMSTYSNFITLYSSIMINNMDTINYEEASAANAINDQVLKTIIQEIYNSDLKIIMPEAYSNNSPYVLVDYESLAKEYGNYYNAATKDYIEFKEIVQKGDLSNADGSYNMERVAEYTIIANNFINKYPNYPLVSDVIYSYILAAKMYAGTYNVSEEFLPASDMVESYKSFLEKYPKTPVSTILENIVEHYNAGTVVTMTEINEWNNYLDSLIG